MMNLQVNIMFGGNCREAVSNYARVFGLPTPQFLTYGERETSFDPNVQVSEQGKAHIMQASLQIGEVTIIFNDMPDNFEFQRGNSFGLILNYADYREARQIFEQLSTNGQVFVPFAEIPGQGYYGMLTDQYDITWTLTA